MKKNVKLVIEYDGTNYIGWQRQPKFQGKSIQGILEDKLELLAGHPVSLNGAGRTDSGVHAREQVANFFLSGSIPVERIPHALAGMLPDDIVVREATEVGEDFHARYSAVEKTYRYTILLPGCRSAFEWRYAYYLPYPLDQAKMEEAAGRFIGTHDFSSFCAKGSPVKTFTRTVRHCSFQKDESHLILEVRANGFLYHMVRIMVGTMLEVGRGRWSPEKVTEILEKKNRKFAGPTALAHGLMLFHVKY